MYVEEMLKVLGSFRNTYWIDIKGCWAIVRKFWKMLKKNLGNGGHQDNVKGQ